MLAHDAVAVWSKTADPSALAHEAPNSLGGTLQDVVALESGDSRENRQEEAAGGRACFEWLRHALDDNAEVFKFLDCVEDQSGLSSESIDLVDEDLVELSCASVLDQALSFPTLVDGDNSANAVVRIEPHD